MVPSTTPGSVTPEEPSSVALDKVVVTAHPFGRRQDEIAQATDALYGSDLSRRQAATLGETLASQPGVNATYFGPGASRPVIRGLGGDRVKVLQNGVGTIDASTLSPDHNVSLDPLLADRIEIVRGPATLLYGSAAIGGVVNAIDNRAPQEIPDTPFTGRFEGRLGSAADERSAAVLFEGADGLGAWHLDGFKRRSNDLRIPGFADPANPVNHGRLTNSAIDSDGAAAGAALINEAGRLGASYSGYNSIYGTVAEEDVTIDMRQRRLDLEGDITRAFGPIRSARAKFGSAEYRHREREGDEIGTIFTNRGYEGRIDLLNAEIAGFEGEIGAQLSRSDFAMIGDERLYPRSLTRNAAVFVFEEAALDPVTLQLGARHEQQRVRLLDDDGVETDRRRRDLFSTSAGFIWTPAPDYAVALSLARSERAPTAQELYSNGPHPATGTFEIGDTGLGKEKSTGVELNFRKRTGWITGAISLFHNRFDGYVFEEATGAIEDDLDVFRYIQRDARFTGGEIEVVAHLLEGGARSLHLRFVADRVRGTAISPDEPLPRIPPLRESIGLEWTRRDWTAGIEVRHANAQNRNASTETRTGAYTLVGASIGRRFEIGGVSYELFLRGANLGDEDARVHTSFLKDIAPLPGRDFMLGLHASF